jgi:ubiquitin-protein ligase
MSVSTLILKEFSKIQRNSENLGYSVELIEGNIEKWEIRILPTLFGKEFQNEFAKFKTDKYEKDYIQARLYFPPDYPKSSVFFHFYYPRIKAHITSNGTLCITRMSQTDWNPNEKLSELILAFIQHADPSTAHIDINSDIPYSLAGALNDHQNATRNNNVVPLSWVHTLNK